MKRIYATAFNNYDTHDQAQSHFYKLESPVALELCKDGSAYIVFLTDKSVTKNQAGFRGTQPKYNDAAKKLMEA